MIYNKPTRRDSIEYLSQGLKIFGVIHRGTSPASTMCPGVVMYHGVLASKYQPPHRLFVNLAEELAQRGIVSLRVDLPGRGDSEGDTIDMSVEADLAAAQQAIDVLFEQPGVDKKRLGLVGISWGGILAASLAGHDPRVAATVLLSTSPYEQVGWKPRLQRIEGRKVYKFVGNLVGEQFFAGMQQLHPVNDLMCAKGPVLYVYGTKDRLVAPKALENFEQRLRSAKISLEVVPIPGGDHAFFEPAMQRQVIEATTTFFQGAFNARPSFR
jgi:uncharacterized protein